jgi:hypothetical protein
MAYYRFGDVPTANLDHRLLSPSAATAARRGIAGVTVFDFGQGDCNAIVDKNREPVVYFDLGGGTKFGSETHPWHRVWRGVHARWRSKLPPMNNEPAIILSHWDTDHYSTAYSLVFGSVDAKIVPYGAPDVRSLKWIVPRQCVHPSKHAFVKRLTNVTCWPAGKTQHRYQLGPSTFLQIERCTGRGKDTNLSGLASIVEREDARGEIVEQMLLPGDAPYAYIPSCRKNRLTKVVALLAFHHGSKTHLRKALRFIPKPLRGTKPRIVYTNGVNRDGERLYGHPVAQAIRAYEALGWTESAHPGGSFEEWPPRPKDLANWRKRTDVMLSFKRRDGRPITAQGPFVKRRPIAMT